MEDVIWAETTDGGLLRQLFGFYPSLHDAVVREVTYDRGANVLSMTVDYYDRPEEADQDLRVRFEMRWEDLRELDLELGSEDVFGLQLRQEGDKIVAEFEKADTFQGRIVAGHFEAVLRQIDPPPDAERPPIRLRIR